MERVDSLWQPVLRAAFRGKGGALGLAALLVAGSGSFLMASTQHFAAAIPALDGPITMGIFSDDGQLVRLLHRDALVDTIPSGLNGLIMSWDGKDDQGHEVTAGTYRARGLVHGLLRSDALPFFTPVAFPAPPEQDPPSPFPSERLVLRSAEDELLETRPLLSVQAVRRDDSITLQAEGLPLLTISLMPGPSPEKVFLRHGARAGVALLEVERGKSRESYCVSGLGQIVPMEAGKLEISGKGTAEAVDASQSGANAGESAP
jgi:hypothetical protein